uniref:RPGRIP1 like n=1 Tax=Scleropages formosus TaxID=113540 RepID=A0A8C9W0C9_SCLFO
MSVVADETAGDLPVRDTSFSLSGGRIFQDSPVPQNVRTQQLVSRVSRKELEDRYLRMHEENLLLKQHAHQQEEKIKRMATKLLRLVKDRKREQQAGLVPRLVGRDVEMEEMMEELQEKVRMLERQNEGLKQRLVTAKLQLQLQAQGRRYGPYGHVKPRVNTGLRKPTPKMQLPGRGAAQATQTLLPRYGHSLLDDARAEIRNLENVIKSQRERIEEMEQSAEILKEQQRRKEREFEEALLRLREEHASEQRSIVKDNVEMIKLQKLLAEKSNAFTVLEGRFLQLQESQRILKGSHDAVMAKVDELSGQLKEEQQQNRALENQLHASSLAQSRAEEMQDRIQDLEKEKDLLKENYDKLLNSAFDVTQEQKWKTREQQLKLQIAQLEVALKSDLADKNEILDKIKLEREQNESLSKQNQELQLRFLEQKQQLDELKDRMKFFTKETDTDMAELSEALMLIKVRKTQKNGGLDFLHKVDENLQQDLERCLKELQVAHAETVQELEKTRSMLTLQHRINKDYQTEVEALTRKMEGIKMEYELKLDRLSQLLDKRAARVRKLEAQLRDIAYGTKAHVLKAEMDEDTADEFDEIVHLERGENLFEIHVARVHLSPEALEELGDPDPCTFCTYAFYDFELQATPVAQGPNPSYGFTSQYTVHMDDSFLHYLQTGAITLELQLASGTDFRTVAACQLRLHHVLDFNGKVSGSAPLIGVTGEVQSFGTVEYWLRLRLPVDQALRLYQERVKALGFLSSSHREKRHTHQVSAKYGTLSIAAGLRGELNELHVTVRGCSDLRSRQAGTQPNPYVVYKLFDFPDRDTRIVPGRSNPQFNDEMVFTLLMDANLDCYLRAEMLMLYVFDDLETESHLYLGKAKVPLISLAHNKSIKGTFELTDPSGQPSGTIDVTLKWKESYLPPPSTPLAVEQTRSFSKEIPQKADSVGERSKVLHPPLSPGPEVWNPTSNTLCLAPKRVNEEDDGKDEEISHVSEGQMATVGSSSTSEDISEDLLDLEQAVTYYNASCDNDQYLTCQNVCKLPHSEQLHRTDPAVYVMLELCTAFSPQPSERIRIEVTSLRLVPTSRVAVDDTISRLFVEFRFLDMPAVETPLSLPKPQAGQTIHYNYSSGENRDNWPLNLPLKAMKMPPRSNPFTVVSDPAEEDQDQDCEDVGVAFVRIIDILEQQHDLIDTSDNRMVVGSLTVTVEALQTLRSIQEEPLLAKS